MILKTCFLKFNALKSSFIKNIGYLFIALAIFVFCTLILFNFYCTTILQQTIPIGSSVLNKKRIYETKRSNVVNNKEFCENDSKTHVVNSTDKNDFTDFYNKAIFDEMRKKFDNFSDQFDQATVSLPRYSKNVVLNNITNSIFFYSSFYQSAENSKLTIVGIAISNIYCSNSSSSNFHNVPQLLCVFDSHHSGELRVKASIDCLPEGHEFYYTSVLIHCSVPARVQKHHHLNQIKVIQRDPRTRHSAVSKIINVINSEEKPSDIPSSSLNNYDITVCVRPLFNTVNVLNLLEFIAYYQTNGITNVVLYYYDFANLTEHSSATALTVHFLHFIGSISGVKLHPFVLPKMIEQSIHSGAQMATIHDCLLRYPNSVQIHVDIDEFVSIEKKWLSIRHWIDDQLESSIKFVALYIANLLHCHEFNFTNSTYYEFVYSKCKQFNTFSNLHQCENYTTKMKNQFYQTLDSKSVKKALIVPNNIYCQETPWPHETRSKVIILQPKLVQHMGIHNVWKYSSPDVLPYNVFTIIQQSIVKMIGLNNNSEKQFYGHKNVNSDKVVLRHYRWCCNMEQPYFLNILHFITMDDTIVRISNHNILAKSKLKMLQLKTINKTNFQIEQFVLHNFKQFLKN